VNVHHSRPTQAKMPHMIFIRKTYDYCAKMSHDIGIKRTTYDICV